MFGGGGAANAIMVHGLLRLVESWGPAATAE
jgi:hypothetical protein